MKPLHVALLVVGAGIAGGLAVKMTQPPPGPVAHVAVPQSSSPPAVSQVAKPTPIPDSVAPAAPETAAPAPIYAESQKAAGKSGVTRATPAKTAIRKNEANLVAQTRSVNRTSPAQSKPTEWIPGKYEGPAESTPAPQPNSTVQPAPPPAPVMPPAPVEQATSQESQAPAIHFEPLPPRQVTLRSGTTVAIRLNQSLSSDRNVAGDTFQAELAEPLTVDGLVIAERGARVTGRIADSQKAGRFSGTSLLQLNLATLVTSDGQRLTISTEPWTKQGDNSNRQNAEKIGGGAALGAIIGAIAGGGKGAAIGAGIGGGAGAGTVAATPGKPVNVPSETVIRFRLASRVTITEQQIAGR